MYKMIKTYIEINKTFRKIVTEALSWTRYRVGWTLHLGDLLDTQVKKEIYQEVYQPQDQVDMNNKIILVTIHIETSLIATHYLKVLDHNMIDSIEIVLAMIKFKDQIIFQLLPHKLSKNKLSNQHIFQMIFEAMPMELQVAILMKLVPEALGVSKYRINRVSHLAARKSQLLLNWLLMILRIMNSLDKKRSKTWHIKHLNLHLKTIDSNKFKTNSLINIIIQKV